MDPGEYERMYGAEEAHWWYAGMRAITLGLLRPALEGEGPLRLLDAGCGTGGMLVHLRPLARGGSAVGAELSEHGLLFCRKRGVPAVRARVGALPFGDACFDGITSLDVIYHRDVLDEDVAMQEMARVLRPGGVVVLRVPALELLRGAHDEAVHTRRRYTRREVRALAEASGFEAVRITYANSLLFPLLALRRGLDRLSGRQGSDVEPLAGPLEALFGGVLRLEARLLGRVSLPVGASVVALLRKPAAGARVRAGSS